MSNWNRMHLSSILSLVAKGLNTFITFANIYKNLFRFVIMGYCVYIDEENVLFNPF
jgi:hypothetical protein